MAFDYDEWIERQGTNAAKWDERKNVFGKEDVIPLWVADMDFACPPAVVEALTERAKHPIYGYTRRGASVYKAIQCWIKRRFNGDVETTSLVMIPGVIPGIFMAIEAFSHPGDKVIIQTPVYHPFYSAIENKGRRLVENPLIEEAGNYRINFDDLEAKVKDKRTKILVLCSPHNPLGIVWSKDELLKMAEICEKHDVLIVSDEIHSDLVYEKGLHTPFYNLPDQYKARGITLIAPSKTFNLAGLYASVAIIEDSKIRQTYQTAMENNAFGSINIFGLEAMKAAYEHGEEWLEGLLSYLKGNAEYIHQFLKERLPDLSMRIPDATYLGWMDFRKLGLDHKALRDFVIHEAGLGLNDGAMFGQKGEGFQRINFATQRKIIVQAMDQLELAMNKRFA